CRSPLASISRSSMPWRATWSSMCSRNGSPVESLAWPRPSRSSLSRICVSLVLRVTSACLISDLSLQRFSQGGEQYTVFIRRADRDAQAIAQRRAVQVLHQHALRAQLLVGAVGVGHPHQEEVRLGRKHGHAVQPPQLLAELLALGADLRRLRFQHLEPLEEESRGRLRQHVHVVNLAHLVEL